MLCPSASSIYLFRSSNTVIARSTETVHTSAKARLTSVAIRMRIRICDPDRHQNLTICSLVHCQPSLKISCNSVRKFLRKVANKQTNRQTTKKTIKHILLGGGNYGISTGMINEQ